MKITRVLCSNTCVKGREVLNNIIYEVPPYKLSVDTVSIKGVKTSVIKKLTLGDKIISNVISVFDKRGKFVEKQKL